jgi:hypothetical protein
MSTTETTVFRLEKDNPALFETFKEAKSLVFESFLPGIADLPEGEIVTIEYHGETVRAEIMQVMPPHPSKTFKKMGRRVELSARK